jgi:hypothetical protein
VPGLDVDGQAGLGHRLEVALGAGEVVLAQMDA